MTIRTNMPSLIARMKKMEKNLPTHVSNAMTQMMYDLRSSIAGGENFGKGILSSAPDRRNKSGKYFDKGSAGSDGGYLNILNDPSMIGLPVVNGNNITAGFIKTSVLNQRTASRRHYWSTIHESGAGAQPNPYLRFIPAKYIKGNKGRSGEGIMIDIRNLKKKKAWHGEKDRGSNYAWHGPNGKSSPIGARKNKPQNINATRFKPNAQWPGIKPYQLIKHIANRFLFRIQRDMRKYLGMSLLRDTIDLQNKRYSALLGKYEDLKQRIKTGDLKHHGTTLQQDIAEIGAAISKLDLQLTRNIANLNGKRLRTPGPSAYDKLTQQPDLPAPTAPEVSPAVKRAMEINKKWNNPNDYRHTTGF